MKALISRFSGLSPATSAFPPQGVALRPLSQIRGFAKTRRCRKVCDPAGDPMLRTRKILAPLALAALLSLASASAQALEVPQLTPPEARSTTNPLLRLGVPSALLPSGLRLLPPQWGIPRPAILDGEFDLPARQRAIDRLREKTLHLPLRPVMLGKSPRNPFDPKPSPGLVIRIPLTL